MSSRSFPPSFGGLERADATCLALAAAAGLNGSWKALLADSAQNVLDRIVIVGPVLDLAGNPIAADPAAFASGNAPVPVNLDETGAPSLGHVSVCVGSATASCDDWASPLSSGLLGQVAFTDEPASWLFGSAQQPCSGIEARLYCISQRP
ncbi:MAG: hypothetical protein ACE5FG_10085 [Myxococcota bacterium]